VILPALRTRYDLSLTEAGALLSAPGIGSILSFIPWGMAADRLGERWVAAVGLAGAAGVTALAAGTGSFVALAALLGVAGLCGAAINAASGRAVMSWFAPSERGLALGIRQTAIPLGGAFAAFGLPAVVAAGGARWGLYALALALLAGALLAALFLREGPAPAQDETHVAEAPLRDRRIWRLLAASFLLLFPQSAVFGYTVLFLHDHRGLSPAGAAHVFAVVQVLGIGARIGAGRWSDAAGSRIRPLRALAVVSCALALATGLAVEAPLGLLLPVLVAGGVASMSWNGLSFTAAAELAGRRRSGASLGLQQTALAIGGAGIPPLFAGLAGSIGWGWAWGLTAAGPLVAAVLLRGLRA
jgi:sugar phosphate permease